MKNSRERLYRDVGKLTGIKPARNYRNLEALKEAVRYIKGELEQLECEVREQSFKVDNRTYKNVVALFKGNSSAERIVVGAHYDVCGEQPGADDNASGVAGLLETARLLHQHKPPLQHDIELVAYCLEEPPYFASEDMGSAVHARKLHEQKIKVRAMICYEMIGYFSDEPHSQKFPDSELAKHYPHTGNFIVVVGKTGQETYTQQVRDLMRQHTDIDVQSVNLPASFGLAGLSDHRNYWKYNINAIMINDSSFLRNPHYHQTSDTIDTLDFDKMAGVVQGVYGVLIRL
ncbi:M28 family peptidase [Pontibacter sp. HSC-36F09]|uniref:M28 family peptidase n=1 Tax=Pontibacter sp. HSC-36F09 TaxID=2910966 RepID=UPI00209E55FF|nr:M28 family peptidase [Pontibacter sp. HSC-36F09]MCP2044840.1 Zn-dependent M28 family amino/carboxypeptidase [Pontibacter sp. HSC-36F09]